MVVVGAVPQKSPNMINEKKTVSVLLYHSPRVVCSKITSKHKKEIRTRRAADLPFAFDGSAGSVVSNDVSPTSESFSIVYYHRDNTQKFSVTTFSGCFLSITELQ